MGQKPISMKGFGTCSHLQEFIAFLLHEAQFLRRVGALPNFDRGLRTLEHNFHRRHIDKWIGTEADANYVLILQHHVVERFLQTVRKMLGSASDGFIDSLRELLFILVTDINVLVVDIVPINERKTSFCDHRRETWSSVRASHSVLRSLRSFGNASEKFHAKLPEFRQRGISVEVAVVQ